MNIKTIKMMAPKDRK